jgi:hypothetical protein
MKAEQEKKAKYVRGRVVFKVVDLEEVDGEELPYLL